MDERRRTKGWRDMDERRRMLRWHYSTEIVNDSLWD